MPVNKIPLTETARTLADFTSRKLIVPSLSGQEASAVIRELSDALQRENRVPDSPAFSQWVIKRELLCGTVTEPGWAIPHGLVKDLSEPCFALGRWLSPKIWTNSNQWVSLVFLFAVPENDVQAYYHLVMGLAEMSKATQLVEQLLKAGDENEMLEVLKQVKLPMPSGS